MHKPTTHALYVLPAFFQRKTFIALAIASTLSACGGSDDDSLAAPRVVKDPGGACAALAGQVVEAAKIGEPTTGATVKSATLKPAVADAPNADGTATVLGTPELRAQWEQELAEMRVRIKQVRSALVERLKAAGVQQDMRFITDQIGMFSYSGLSKDQMVRLRDEFSVYGTDTGRMCVAALNSKNIDYVCQSIAKVI